MIYTISSDLDKFPGYYLENEGQHPFGAFINGDKVEDWNGKPLQFVTTPSDETIGPLNPLPWDYINYCSIVTPHFLKILTDAHVTNIESFPATIRHHENLWTIENCKVINVLGGIHRVINSSVDQNRSIDNILETVNRVMESDTDQLSVDTSKVPELKLFLWAEGQWACSQELADSIQKAGFTGIELTPIPDAK